MSSDPLPLLRAATHIQNQSRVIGALLGTVARSSWRKRPGARAVAPPTVPGPELSDRVTSPSTRLVRDYGRLFGATSDARTVPAHLFPQWTFPLAARVLGEVPYDLPRV